MSGAISTTHQISVPEIGLVDVTVAEQGRGAAHVILHGGAGPQSVQGFAELLAESGARVLTPTHPGFDGTTRPDALDSMRGLASMYVALVEELGLSDVTLIGNSIGGWIAAEMALLGSSRIARFVLVNATGIEVPGHPVADISTLTVQEVMQLSYHDPAAFPVDPSTWPAPVRAKAAGNRSTLAVYAGVTGSDAGLQPRLKSLDVPVLVVWGESDQIVDPEYGRAFAEAIPNAHFHLVTAAGHLPQIETPQELLVAISDFTVTHSPWSHDFTVEAEVAAEDIWATLKDLYTGTKLSADGDNIVIHGSFTVGTKLSATPAGSDTAIECTISALVEGRVLSLQSDFNGLIITSSHELTRLDDGGTHVTQTSTITGPRAGRLGPQIGPRITADHPAAMNDLLAAAKTRRHDDR